MPTRIERLPPGAADPDAASQAYQTCVEIRRKVFIDGQAVPVEIEFDGLDRDSQHFLALCDHDDHDDGAAPVALGTARMRIVNGIAKAERVAVLEQARGSGIGREIMESIESHAREQGLESVHLNAQLQAAGFYQKLGYLAEGDVFIEAGIAHRSMTKRLA
jgi:predicted GNAT family N-acyltransferase